MANWFEEYRVTCLYKNASGLLDFEFNGIRLVDINDKETFKIVNIDDIKRNIYKRGVPLYLYKRVALLNYFKWLYETYGIDTSELYYQVSQLEMDEVNNNFIFSINDLYVLLESVLNLGIKLNRDLYGVVTFFILSWYGVTREEFLSIRKIDVHNDYVFIPLTNREVTVDNQPFALIRKYSEMNEFANGRPYHGEMLIRSAPTTGNPGTNLKGTLNSAVNLLKTLSKNKDLFLYTNIYKNGRFNALVKEEEKLDRELTVKDVEIFRNVFNVDYTENRRYVVLKEYKMYKNEYLKYIENTETKIDF